MKKKIWTAAILAALTTTPAFAACKGGTMSEDGKFCISNIELNWWSAATWCQANGMHLATIYEACPDWSGSTGSGACGRVVSGYVSDYSWTATTNTSTLAFYVTPSSGSVTNYYKSSKFRAVCAPN